ncbi:hypothetical protein WS87_08660 [Burkholderia sp. MSMB0856]|uniref:hypothetical protein n=1 Tax=Burkholderia sp. MSMB0856 TaxID=1637869 RepID=UPI0007564D72|nr:hypothetical protein [Burkholderia sp. MSMB0856]AOJ86739.1 hypothetical protein WS87_08660 [Burkholderia sp. MSMB0856]KVH38080.1 hypothetical protein WS87_00270 [Burkholderia sp. MSMB0856]
MTIFERPDEDVFADGARPGEVDEFPNVARGWGVALDQTGGKPPMEWFNWLGRRIDRAIRYFMQRGLAEWSSTETYPVGAVVQHNGIIYRADVENEGRAPDGSPGHWGAPWAPTVAADDSSKRVVNTELLAKRLEKYVSEDDLGTYATQEWVKGYAVKGDTARYVLTTNPDRSAAGLTVDGKYIGKIWTDMSFDPGTKVNRGGDTITDRLTLGRDGWQADLALQNRRPGQNVTMYIRARDGGGIEFINNAYNGVPWSMSDAGTTWQAGNLNVGGSTLQTDGNLLCNFRGAWLNSILDDLYARSENRAVAGARVQWDSGLAEFDYVGSVSSNVHGQIDLPAPWVVTGMRVNADNRSITAIWQRGVVLRNQ